MATIVRLIVDLRWSSNGSSRCYDNAFVRLIVDTDEMIPISIILLVKDLRDKAFIFGTNLVFIWPLILPATIRPIPLGAHSIENDCEAQWK
jgi:hypothetical protein